MLSFIYQFLQKYVLLWCLEAIYILCAMNFRADKYNVGFCYCCHPRSKKNTQSEREREKVRVSNTILFAIEEMESDFHFMGKWL